MRSGQHVVYWIQQSHRVHHNPVLGYALKRADELNKPCFVVFGLTDEFPDVNARGTLGDEGSLLNEEFDSWSSAAGPIRLRFPTPILRLSR